MTVVNAQKDSVASIARIVCTSKNYLLKHNNFAVLCTDMSGFDFNAENPTLTLVIRSRSQLSAVIEQATESVQSIVDLLASEPGYLSKFIVVLFDNGSEF